MKKLFFFALLFTASFLVQAQGVYSPNNSDYRHLADRYLVKGGAFTSDLNRTVRPLLRPHLALLADTLLAEDERLNKQDRFNLLYLANDNFAHSLYHEADSKKPFLKYFYKKKASMFYTGYEYNHLNLNRGRDNYEFHVNPLFHFAVGNSDDLTGENGQFFINRRGVRVHGSLAERIHFMSEITENQLRMPLYGQAFQDTTGAVPHAAFWKEFNGDGYDYFLAEGYLNFKITKFIEASLGHGRHFMGNGYRSLFLSDFAPPALYARFTTSFWKLKYTSIFTQMTADVQRANNVFPKKYVVMHHLSWDVFKNLNVGIFEGIAYGRKDNRKNDALELGYLNPVIFYRSVEQNLGSADNAMLGVDFRWNLMRTLQFYGQIVLDEFVLSEVQAGNGWWANKQAFQLGAKYFDVFGMKNLDLQGEINYVRPYMYTHFNDEEPSNWMHFNQPLAHPLGANFQELVGIVRYQPMPRLQLVGKAFLIRTGDDVNGSNVGTNILIDNTIRDGEYGHEMAQGVETNIRLLSFRASYQIRHNIFLDAQAVLRDKDSAIDSRDLQTTWLQGGLRINLAPYRLEF